MYEYDGYSLSEMGRENFATLLNLEGRRISAAKIRLCQIKFM